MKKSMYNFKKSLKTFDVLFWFVIENLKIQNENELNLFFAFSFFDESHVKKKNFDKIFIDCNIGIFFKNINVYMKCKKRL